MEEITMRLNDFLFNSGVLGFYRILENADKTELMQIEGNTIKITKQVLESFTSDYFNCMIDKYEKDTKWYTITNKKEWIKNLKLEETEKVKQLEEQYKFIKKSVESASYKAGYEILKSKKVKENPYEYIEQLKDEKEPEKRKEIILKIVEYIETNKRVYCMKDIVYTKINCFWSNVAFLNRNANKNDMEEEYQKVFVEPALQYLANNRKSNITCTQCGNIISKKEASGMSWLNDTGVDFNRKKSGFWNFKEDMFLCPICNLIYSCIPLGFKMIGSNGIFVNNNESIKKLKQYNDILIIEENAKEEIFEKVYGKVISHFINQTNQLANEKMEEYEPRNIQVIKRIGEKENQKYEFNMLSKDKLEILKKTTPYFKKLLGSSLYQEVLTNLIEGRKQYYLIARIFKENKNIEVIRSILLIQLNCMGGIDLKEREKRIDEMIEEGQKLKKYFFANGENENKLTAYGHNLQEALNASSIEKFMKFFTLFYGSLKIPMPNCEAIKVLLKEPEYFKLLGYAYLYGLGVRLEKKEEVEKVEK